MSFEACQRKPIDAPQRARRCHQHRRHRAGLTVAERLRRELPRSPGDPSSTGTQRRTARVPEEAHLSGRPHAKIVLPIWADRRGGSVATQRGYRISRTETPEMRAREITVRILGLPKEHRARGRNPCCRKGDRSASVCQLAEYIRVPEGDVLEAVDISRSTFSRRKKAKRLTTEESDRVYRLTRLLGRAVAVLGDEAEARQWMQYSQACARERESIDHG